MYDPNRMNTETPWHRASYERLMQERLPQLLSERLPVLAYRAEASGAYTCRVAVVLAALLSQRFYGKNFFRVVYLIPMACPPIAVAFLWRMMLHPDIGVFNSILKLIGLQGVKWTTDVRIAPFTIIMVDVWEWTPFMFLALLAAFQSLPMELYQAAAVDGANGWQMFTHITLPLITPVIVTISLIRAIDAFKLFELVFGITGGGPGGATESLSYYAYLIGMKWFKLGRGSSISWIFVVILLLLAIALISRFKKSRA